MPQGALPFQYAEEKGSTGMTALSGLATYLDLARVAGLNESARRHVGIKEGKQGWTDSQMITSLALLNLAGGESVDHLRVLEKDEGLGRVLSLAESHGIRRRERQDLKRRWRKERRRGAPAASAVSGISRCSMTPQRRSGGRRTRHSYRPPPMRCLV